MQLARVAASKVKAKAALAEAVREILEPDEDPDLTTVEKVMDEWLEALARRKLSPTTIQAYRNCANRSLRGTSLSAMDVTKVNKGRVWRLLQDTADAKGAGEAKLLRTVIMNVLDQAVRNELVESNAARGGLPTIEKSAPKEHARPRDTSRAFTREELASVLQFADEDTWTTEHNLTPLIYVLAGTGCRIGEAIALRWTDFDGKKRTLDVHGTVQRITGEGVSVKGTTKSDAGMRKIEVPGWLVDYLVQYRDRQPSEPAEGERLAVAAPSEFICATVTGALRDGSNTNRDLRASLASAGFDFATAHTFRKTVATILDEEGLSAREIAAYLGHRHPSLTQDVYMDKRRMASTAGKHLGSVLPAATPA